MRLTRTTKIIFAILLWQLISVGLISVGVWPDWLGYVNTGIILLFLIFSSSFDGLLLIIASSPFYIFLSNKFLSLPSWRPLYLALALLWLLKNLRSKQAIFSLLKKLKSWDYLFIAFIALATISLLVARFPVHGFKQIVFLINIYIIYFIVIQVVNSKEKLLKVLSYSALSTGIFVFIGYIQFFITLFSAQYYFWQYWAVMVSKTYYGLPLANVLIYSNSWFQDSGGQKVLRMFSVLPDSHSFAMMAVFFIGFALPLTSYYLKPKNGYKAWLVSKNYLLWSAIRFSGLAVILSGTRGVWAGMIPPFILAGIAFFAKFAKPLMKKILIAQILIVLLFALSPVINYGLNLVRFSGYEENFIDRAKSIYDLNEQSNVGRLLIWKESSLYALTHPLGTGYANFIVSIADNVSGDQTYEQLGEVKNLRYNLPQKFITAHSLYLNILVELGILGLIIFIWFCLDIFYRLFLYLKQNTVDTFENMTVASLGIIILWTFAYGVFDVALFNDRVLFFFFVSLALMSGAMNSFWNTNKKEG